MNMDPTRTLLELAATELEQQHAMLVERDHEYEEAREHRLAREMKRLREAHEALLATIDALGGGGA